MAVVEKTLNISEGDQSVQYWSSKVDSNVVHTNIIIEGVDSDVKFSWFQGNDNISPAYGFTSDHFAPIEDHKEKPIELIAGNGNYMIAINTFYGKYGDVRLDVQSATTGTIKIINNTLTPRK